MTDRAMKLHNMLNGIEYAIEKLNKVPAFGDRIGKNVNKAEIGIALNKLNDVRRQLEGEFLDVLDEENKGQTKDKYYERI